MTGRVRSPLWAALALLCLACDSAVLNLVDSAGSGDSAGRSGSDAAVRDAALPDGGGVIVMCGNRPCACSDGRDDDGDGLVDGLDPECSGAFDDDEASFATGGNIDTRNCRDCFWDDNSGAGNDNCRYPVACLHGDAPPTSGNCQTCDVSASCISSCMPRTPNGCDCFGCCEVTRSDGSKLSIEVSPACSMAKLDDATACPRCVQNTACRNPCGRCELCPGRTSADLPPDCAATSAPGAPAYRCDEGQLVCTDTQDCPANTYCQLGCCLAVLL